MVHHSYGGNNISSYKTCSIFKQISDDDSKIKKVHKVEKMESWYDFKD